MAIEENDNPFQALLNDLGQGVLQFDCTGTILFSNTVYHRMLGYDPGERIGTKICDHLHPTSNKTQFKRYLANLVKNQPEPAPFIITNRKKDGTPVDLHIDWNYSYDKNGDLTGFAAITTVICTPENLQESFVNLNREYATLLRICKSLAETLHLHEVLQVSVDSVVELVGLDTAAVYLLENDTLQLWATTPQLPADFPDQLRFAPLADHPHIQKAFNTGQPVYIEDYLHEDLSPAERAIAKMRNLRTLLFVPLLLEEKAMGIFIVGSIAEPTILSDVRIDLARTLAGLSSLSLKNARLYEESNKYALRLQQMLLDRNHLMDENSKLVSQLQQAQKMEAIGTLAGGIAHDFNNILTPIIGYAELALQTIDPADAVAHLISEIVKASNRAKLLVREILFFSRKEEQVAIPFSAEKVIKDSLKLLRASFPATIDIEENLCENCGSILGDPIQLQQVIMNICTNAYHAMRDTGGILTVSLGMASLRDDDEMFLSQQLSAGPHIAIEINDTGSGIDKEIIDKIFEPYFTTKEKGSGTGLGLATVHGIVKRHGGNITVQSTPGKGTTFHVYLPCKKVLHQEGIEAGNPAPLPQGNERLLLIDDEVTITNTLQDILKTLGYKVTSFNDSEAALQAFAETPDDFDLIITDMTMPHLTGLDLSIQILTIRPQVPIILCTGYSELIDKENAQKSGVYELLMKPLSMKDIANSVRTALDRN